MRSERKKLKGKINKSKITYKSLASELQILESQTEALETSVESASRLQIKLKRVQSRSKPVKKLVRDQIAEYQELKEATDAFKAWAVKTHDQATTMRALCDDEETLRKMTRNVLRTLQGAKNESIRAICAPIRSLKVTGT
jgi:multidrug resistance efflux pump